VLQTKARKSQVPIDSLSFEFVIINLDEAEISAAPREGGGLRLLLLLLLLQLKAAPAHWIVCGGVRVGVGAQQNGCQSG